ncbi:hypothetical protein CRE_30458 [Caenorhabditis remanei]|uniref:Uncharacterized protein n=1 Tax=Caenorhabditis remanei TaxID=31234 RepID=E3NDX1_CAERE|nr:hypothetical protein CRE_30458 [Caenorhabditis remanei]
MMKEFIKKEIKEEEPEEDAHVFQEEDAHVLGDDEPDGDMPELPKIAARQRKPKLVKIRGKTRKRKTRKTKSKTGTTKRRKGTKRRRKTTKTTRKTTETGVKIGRINRFGREKEPKLHIRQNDDVIVFDEEPEERKPTIAPPAPPKPTPPNILDSILFAQEKFIGGVDPKKVDVKNKTLPNGRRSVW